MCAAGNPTYNIHNFEYDCKNNTFHDRCADKIISALTKNSIDDENLIRYIVKCCRHFAKINDSKGKTALHIAASTGRYKIVEWLIDNGALIDFKCQESGDTALHWAIFYGYIDCAVLLLRCGANNEILNIKYLTPMHHICKSPKHLEDAKHLHKINKIKEYTFWNKDACHNYTKCTKMVFNMNMNNNHELLVWGTNKNFNLGIGTEGDVTYPQFIDYFRKRNINIISMAISSFHSLFLDDKYRIYSVGHGEGGRLGNYSENILTLPKEIKSIGGSNNCVWKISCSRNHSLILMNKNSVYSCGKNNHFQLGYKTQEHKSKVFKKVPLTEENQILEIIAKEQHSLAATKTSIHVWGTNNGQFGNSNANVKYLLNPKPLELKFPNSITKIACVASSNTAIACLFDDYGMNKVLLFHKNQTKFFKFPFFDSFPTSICLCEKKIEKIKTKQNQKTEQSSSLTTNNNIEMLIYSEYDIYKWDEDTGETYCCFLTKRNMPIEKILFKNDKILLLSGGDLYQGTIKRTALTKNQSFITSILLSSNPVGCKKIKTSSTHGYNIELKNLLHFDRVRDIFFDDDLQSFGLIQDNSNKYYQVPETRKLFINKNFSSLLNDSNEFDQIHDIVIHVDTNTFYCHKYVLFLKSSGLRDIINESNDKKNIHLNYEYFTSKMFEIILKHIYEDYVLSEQDFADISNSLSSRDSCNYQIEKNDINMECFDFVHLLAPRHISVHSFLSFLDYTVKFGLQNLVKYVKNFPMTLEDGEKSNLQDQQEEQHEVAQITLFPELYDINIICKDNRKIKAHKCVLVSRSDYFKAMFCTYWSVKNVIKLETIPYEYMSTIIDFLYTPNIEKFRNKNYPEKYLYELITICDQFLEYDLRNVCEKIIAENISVKKCGDLLQFAHTYNCSQLENCCLDFICQNLQRVLVHKSLEVCEYDVLKKINVYYRQLFDVPIIKTHPDAIDDSELLKFVENFHVELSNEKTENSPLNKIKKKSKIKNMNKFEQSKRDCEIQAINSMDKLLLIDDKIKNLSISSNDNNENDKNDSINTKQNDEKEQSELTKKWQKVNDKKINKKHPKKCLLEGIIEPNNIAIKEKQKMCYNEPKYINDEFTILNSKLFDKKYKTDENKSVIVDKNRSHNYNFGDVLPRVNEKTSQKQRKRLSLESQCTDSNSNVLKSNAIPISNNNNNDIDNNSLNLLSPIKANEVISFAEIIKSPKNPENLQFKISQKNNDDSKFLMPTSPSLLSSNTGAIPKTQTISKRSSNNNRQQKNNNNTLEFSKILEDEKRQKKYCEQLKNKSLALTQIEETAIDELKQFYNVDNVYDENITIERKLMPITRNFNLWQYNKKK